MRDFLLQRGRFRRGLATDASAFLSTGVTSRPTGGSQRYALDIQGRIDVAVVFCAALSARLFPDRQRHFFLNMGLPSTIYNRAVIFIGRNE